MLDGHVARNDNSTVAGRRRAPTLAAVPSPRSVVTRAQELRARLTKLKGLGLFYGALSSAGLLRNIPTNPFLLDGSQKKLITECSNWTAS
jgi:hypothetical protein